MARYAVNANLSGGVNPVTNAKRSDIAAAGDVTTGITSSLSSALSATTSLSTANLAVSSALSVLTADAAAPTQAHVTTATAAFATANTGISSALSSLALVSTTPVTTPDAQLSWNTTNITSLTQLKHAVAALLHAAQASGKLTD